MTKNAQRRQAILAEASITGTAWDRGWFPERSAAPAVLAIERNFVGTMRY